MLAACQINSAESLASARDGLQVSSRCWDTFSLWMSLTGTSGVRLGGEEADLADACIMSATAVKAGLPALLQHGEA